MIYSLFQLLLYFAMATLNWIIFKTRFDQKKKKKSHFLVFRQKGTDTNCINCPTIYSPKIDVSPGSGSTWMTVSYGRSNAQVLPWFRFPTFISCGAFEESSCVSGYHRVKMNVTSTTAASVGVWGSEIFSVPLPSTYCSLERNHLIGPFCWYIRRKNLSLLVKSS